MQIIGGQVGSITIIWSKYDTYLKYYKEQIDKIYDKEQAMRIAVGKTHLVSFMDSSIYSNVRQYMKNRSRWFSWEISSDFNSESHNICSMLMKRYPETASKYSTIKYFSETTQFGIPVYSPDPFRSSPSVWLDESMRKTIVDKNSDNTIIEDIEKQLNMFKNYMEEINRGKVNFVNGLWGYKNSSYIPKVKNYDEIINEYNTFATKLKSQINTEVARVNRICDLVMLR